MSDLSVNKYINKEIKNIEALFVDLANLYSHDHLKIMTELEAIPNIDQSNLNKIIDAHKLLTESPKIDSTLRELLKSSSFIDKNPSLILSLAKLFFHSDKIELKDEKILISKEVELPNNDQSTPEIDENKTIAMVLKKVKYNRLQNKDLKKIDELQTYDKYKNLHKLLLKAVDSQTLIQDLNDNDLFMTTDQLSSFLDK